MENKHSLDYLTGVHNRMGLYDIFSKYEKSLFLNVLFFDLDNFKTVNDVYGHEKGDETLVSFARIITNVAPKDSVVARLGGDEFVLIIPEPYSKAEVSRTADNIQSEVRRLKNRDRAFEVLSSSIGILCHFNVDEGLDLALSCADKAMYFAKKKGKDNYVFYEDYEQIINYESQIEKGIAEALDKKQIIIKYHPTLHLQSSRLVCTQACCFWNRPDGSVLGRNDFRPVLLKNKYINNVDLYIFELVCRDYLKIKPFNPLKHKVSVQFSHLLLLDDSGIEYLFQIMDRYGARAEDFELDFDESMFSERVSIETIIRNLKKYKEAGFSIALSHFAQDFSSFRYLKMLPISSVKFDYDYVKESLKSAEDEKTLKSIIKLCKDFNLLAISYMVDDVESMVHMSECGFDAAAGDYFSTKLSIEDYCEFLKAKINKKPKTLCYRFQGDLRTENDLFGGKIDGSGIEFSKGISAKWGAVSFPGGPVRTNVIKFPTEIFEDSSYSFSLWLKPAETKSWVSAIYIRYQGGFASFMPNIAGGRCMYRINEDAHMDIWHDAMSYGLGAGKWSFVTVTFDSITSVVRLYVNGELETVLSKIPQMGKPKEIWLGGDVFQQSYQGLISAISVDSGALEEEEIKRRYDLFCEEEGFSGLEVDEEYKPVSIEVHDPAIFEDKDSGDFYIYSTGGQGYVSKDLNNWNSLGTVVKNTLTEAIEHTGTDSIWAPDIYKFQNEYRLYCSNSSWGSRNSCIFLAVADSPKGPFSPKAIVHKTTNEGNVNAIDANIIEDHRNHKLYMVYGSFWGGIHILELDPKTGLTLPGQGNGITIARRPEWNESAIEGPYILYHPDTDYYYLFVSYGSLTCDYNIRVARSKDILGPYLDYNGKDMMDLSDENCSNGLMIACGYRYLEGQAYMGPGHNSVLLRQDKNMYLVCHIRKMSFNADPGPGILQIRKMVMTKDGWPITLGQPYSLVAPDTNIEVINGSYERIELRPSIPQGISHAHPMKLLENGRLEIASIIGKWENIGDHELLLSYGNKTEYVYYERGFDKEKNVTTIIMGGLNSDGICTWAKKLEVD